MSRLRQRYASDTFITDILLAAGRASFGASSLNAAWGHSVKPRMHSTMVLAYYSLIDLGLPSLRSWQRTKRRFPRVSPIRFPSSIAPAMPPLLAAAWSF
jgi:hypothetical protein